MWDASQCALNTCAKAKKTRHRTSLSNWERRCCPMSAHVWVLRVLGSTKTGGLSEVTCEQRIDVLSTILYDKQWWLSKLSIKVEVSLWWTENNTKNSPKLCMCWAVLGPFSCARLFATPWTPLSVAPLSTGFSRQESWSGLPFPSPEDLPNPGIEPRSGRFFTV